MNDDQPADPVEAMTSRLVDAARAAVARPDRGPLDELADAIADYDAAVVWYRGGAR